MAQVKKERNKYFEAKRNQTKEGTEGQARNSNRGSKPDVEAGTSNVVTGQLSVANLTLHVLFDSGATHSFVSSVCASKMNRVRELITRTFRTSLPSVDVLVSTHWLRAIPVLVSNRELYVDLIMLNLHDYDVILGMDFLSKYNATIECRH
ncbi:hypothetical protein UlMin_010863 [Ulmus minor]